MKQQIKDLMPMKRACERAGVKLELAGGGDRSIGKCPFCCQESTEKSFKVDHKKQAFECTSCHSKGDVFDFVARCDKTDKESAIEKLAIELGLVGERQTEEQCLAIAELQIPFNIDESRAKIRRHKEQIACNVWGIGNELARAKAELAHGEWLPYLAHADVGFSPTVAENIIRVATEIPNSPTSGILSASKLFELLPIPAAEREDFINTKHILPSGEEKTLQEMTVQETRAVRKASYPSSQCRKISTERVADDYIAVIVKKLSAVHEFAKGSEHSCGVEAAAAILECIEKVRLLERNSLFPMLEITERAA